LKKTFELGNEETMRCLRLMARNADRTSAALSHDAEKEIFSLYQMAKDAKKELGQAKKSVSPGSGSGMEDVELGIARLDAMLALIKSIVVSSNQGILSIFARQEMYHSGARHLSIEDLMQVGNIEIIDHAMDRFDHRRGVRFYSYAQWALRTTMRHAVKNLENEIRRPPWVTDAAGKISEVTASVTTKEGRPPSDEELIAKTGLSVMAVCACRRSKPLTRMVSLFEKIGDEGDKVMMDLIADRTEGFEERVIRRQLLGLAFEALSQREIEVLVRRYCMDKAGRERMETRTLDEVGGEMRITLERVRQLEKRALGKLRKRIIRLEAGRQAAASGPQEEGLRC